MKFMIYFVLKRRTLGEEGEERRREEERRSHHMLERDTHTLAP